MQTMAQRAPRAEQAPASRQARGDAVQRKDVDSPRSSEASTLAYGRMLHQGPAVQRVAAYQAMADRRPVAQRVTQLENGNGGGGMPSGASWMLGGMGGYLAMNRFLIDRAQGGTGIRPLATFGMGMAHPMGAMADMGLNLRTLMRGPMAARALAISPLMLGLFGAGYNFSQGRGFWPSGAPGD